MIHPRMLVIAGPPGSGKSTAFAVSSFGMASFNADDRAASLNAGSYLGIPNHIRQEVNREFEKFVVGCIERRESFAIETTLRSHVTFDQARLAKAAGFTTEIRYLALADFAMHLERVKIRADAGGHSASESTLRRIYDSSVNNLRHAVEIVDVLRVYDNSEFDAPPRLILEAHSGHITTTVEPKPAWLTTALALG